MVMAPETRKNSSMSCEEFGTLVATNPQALLSFYVDHSKMSLGRLRQGLINLTQNPDLEMLFHHCSFVSIWMNLAYLAATDIGFMEMPEEVKASKNVLISFIGKLLNGLTPEFRRLQLDPVEFAALKAISVWKMSILGDNETARVLSGEQYLGVAKSLNEYHQALYQEMITVYTTLNIDDCYRGDFC
ncbi:Protein CBG10331 [Caenorhabditis briggsae]|uniref:Protein CBG10331 n=1 Tax=Caenorhabditis briggsae TaxID=6238 RepID=A8XAK6_CAEBR|nr:Protein CBG10331 [Caenorhabditis briggsae]CAP29671.2 Protein CBG10331 [Caenorhabditis briggsae]